MSTRLLLNLVRALPPDSAIARATDPHAAVGWGNAEELLALLAELVDLGNRTFLSANARPGVRVPEPVQIPRPGESVEVCRRASPSDVSRLLDAGSWWSGRPN